MRDDMSKVLVESPRLGRASASALEGSRRQRRHRLDRDGESAPQRVGMRRDALSRKHFGEHLGPLYRYLRQQVHRPWAKVYGELCTAQRQRQERQRKLALGHPDRRSGLPGMAPDGQWQRIDGIWYEVRLAPLDVRDAKTLVFDVVLKRRVSGLHRELLRATHGRPGCYAILKRQLDSATLRRNGLRTSP